MKWLSYLMPPREMENHVLRESGVLSEAESVIENGSSLRRLLDETSDLIDSPSFTHVLSLLNNEAFSHLIDNKCAIEAFKAPPPQPTTHISYVEEEEVTSSATIVPDSKPASPKAKLATVLAVVSRQAHSVGNGNNPPNDYLVAMEKGVRELEAFAAVVYSTNFDLESTKSRPDTAPESSPSGAQPAAQEPISESAMLGSSIVDLGDSSVLRRDGHEGFETAWGKAVEESS